MRFKEKKRDFADISRRSIQRDFQRPQYRENVKRKEQPKQEPQEDATRRIAFIGANSSYFKFRHLLVGRLVRLVEQSSVGGWICEFIHDEDRKELNKAAEWSNNKKQYLLDCIKFK